MTLYYKVYLSHFHSIQSIYLIACDIEISTIYLQLSATICTCVQHLLFKIRLHIMCIKHISFFVIIILLCPLIASNCMNRSRRLFYTFSLNEINNLKINYHNNYLFDVLFSQNDCFEKAIF